MRIPSLILAAAAALALPAAAQAQFSDSYTFLKAVRDKDGAKAQDIMSKPGSVIIDTRDSSSGETALHIVTRRRDMDWLRFLLARNAKTDIKDGEGDTPLMIAAQIGFIDGAQELIRKKANVNLTNRSGESPLIRAVQRNDAAMVRALMTAGANPAKADSVAGLSARDYAQRDRRLAPILKIIDETKPAAAKPVAGPK